jgi:uncharacterized membrane protein
MSSRSLIVAALIGALLGFGFAAASTFDFSAHLDRQVHNLHCSFIPGMSSSAASAQGCQVTLMSPYSSVFRSNVWGGLPVSLPAMSIFAALAGLTGVMLLLRAEHEPTALFVLLVLAIIPVAATLVMGSIAAFKLGAACKQCIGIYSASLIVGVSAFLAYRARPRTRVVGPVSDGPGPVSLVNKAWLLALPLAALLVLVPMTGYVLAMPEYDKFAEGCGRLPQPEDRHSVFVRLKVESPSAKPAIEIFDPLCPACKAFEDRLHAAGLDKEVRRDLLLFPLDNACNWMIDNALHPGSCAVSMAVLCAGDRAKEVVDWAFAEQAKLQAAGVSDASAPGRMAAEKFPELKVCMDAPTTKTRLTQSLRWAVRNQVPVLTPQFYVDGKRLCDEDTDLGLEYTLTRMLRSGS